MTDIITFLFAVGGFAIGFIAVQKYLDWKHQENEEKYDA